MITTIDPLLISASNRLNESSEDYTPQRIDFCNTAIAEVLGQYAWNCRRKSFTLVTTPGVQTYDFTSSSVLPNDDYDPEFGFYEIWNGEQRLDPILYDNMDNFSESDCFAISPDNTSLVFTLSQTSSNTYTVWYYARHKDVGAKTTVLNLSIPDNLKKPIVTYIKYLVHDAKRQRNDARNALLDFEEQIGDVKLAQGKAKAKGLKQNIPTPIAYSKFKRKYAF